MRMRCGHARSVVSDYIDGDLDAQTSRLLEEHIQECPNCPPVYAALLEVRARLAATARHIHPRDREFAERIRNAL